MPSVQQTVPVIAPPTAPEKLDMILIHTKPIKGGHSLTIRSPRLGRYFREMAESCSQRDNRDVTVSGGALGSCSLEFENRLYWNLSRQDKRFPASLKYTPNSLGSIDPIACTFLLLDKDLEVGYTVEARGEFLPKDLIENIANTLRTTTIELYKQYIAPYEVIVTVKFTEVV